ncbi:MAG: aldehyde dehydrogenase family protein [Actinomycetota bacterium]
MTTTDAPDTDVPDTDVPDTDAPGTDWRSAAATIRRPTRPVIDGAPVDALTDDTFDSVGPRDGEVVATLPACGQADVDRAVAAGRAAFDDGRWRDLPPAGRKAVLHRFADLVEQHRDELALLETLDTGKPIGDTTSVDAPGAATTLRWYAEACDKIYGEVAPTGRDTLATITREPMGVVAAIVPWNYPLIITAWKLGPALATGNAVVVKPAEQSPMATLRLAELAAEAGLPPGVLNVVPGEGPTGAALASHGDVDKVTFTGSTATGRRVLEAAAASNLKSVSLELGGKSPQVVFGDLPDVAAAAEAIAWGIFYNQGQTCHAGSRLVVDAAIADELVERIAEVARDLVPGDPLDAATQLGALVSREQLDRVVGYLDLAGEEGAAVALDGGTAAPVEGGCYLAPTILDHVDADARIATEEIFGPVLVVQRFDGRADGAEDEALRLANGTAYGLAGAVWSADHARAERVAAGLRAGSVYINCFDLGDVTVPHGGFGASGFGGRDKSLHALEQYTELKTTWRQL